MLTAIAVVETMLLLLMAVVMVGLLRSHAEILRRLPGPDDVSDADGTGRAPESMSLERHGIEPVAAGGIPDHLPAPRPEVTPAHEIAGRTLEGDAVVLSPAAGVDTLVAFLSSGCMTCRTFWDGLQPSARRSLPGGARVIVVTKDAQLESPSRLRALAPSDVPVVMSSSAWESYGIPMSPYFVYVDGTSGRVRSEGAASAWDQVSSLLEDALADEDLVGRARA
jgi:hypothetical protein